VTLTATSGEDVSKSASATITISASGTLAQFSGDFAFLFNGFDSGGAVAAAGTFTADGAGNLTGGLADINRASGIATARAFTGTYTVAPEGRGTLAMTSSPEETPLGTFQFILNGAGNAAHFFEADSSGTIGSGIIEKQALGALSAPGFKGDFALGLSGADPNGNRFGLAGRFHADAAGKITAGVFDTDDGGAVAPDVAFAGTDAAASTGRGVLTVTTSSGTLHWASYTVSPGEAFLVSTDARLTAPLSSGRVLAQSPNEPGGFSTASLDGTNVLSFAGAGPAGAGSVVGAGLATFDGAGGFEIQLDENNRGAVKSLSTTGTYAIAPSGRATIAITGRANLLVAYLVSKDEGFLVGTGAEASTGFFEPQAPGPFTGASVTGQYVFGTITAPTSGSSFEWGVMSYRAAGNISGTADRTSAAQVLSPGRAFSDTFSVSSNGRVAMGSGGIVMFLVSPSKAVAVDVRPGQANATLSSLEKWSAEAAARVIHSGRPR